VRLKPSPAFSAHWERVVALPDRQEHEELVEEEARKLRVEFSNYENAVNLISSLEKWFVDTWGQERDPPLVEFNRFPKCGDLTPDFLVRFGTPYLLCGEVMRTFRTGHGGERDIAQLVSYSEWQPPPEQDGNQPLRDVMLLVRSENHDVAAHAVAEARASREPSDPEMGAIVIFGYYRDVEAVNREYYILKWNDIEGNSKFRTPNAPHVNKGKDLNALLVDIAYCPIRVDQDALHVQRKCPLINDPAPALYLLTLVVWPAVMSLLTDDEQDALQVDKKISKTIKCSEVQSSEVGSNAGVSKAQIKMALDFLVDARLARFEASSGEGAYVVEIDLKAAKAQQDEYFAEKRARRTVSQMKAKRRSHKAGDQLALFGVNNDEGQAPGPVGPPSGKARATRERDTPPASSG